jgi:hypothetical protein
MLRPRSLVYRLEIDGISNRPAHGGELPVPRMGYVLAWLVLRPSDAWCLQRRFFFRGSGHGIAVLARASLPSRKLNVAAKGKPPRGQLLGSRMPLGV